MYPKSPIRTIMKSN